MPEDELAFLRRRAREEAASARAATAPEAAEVHRRFALAYRARLAAAEARQTAAPIDLSWSVTAERQDLVLEGEQLTAEYSMPLG